MQNNKKKLCKKEHQEAFEKIKSVSKSVRNHHFDVLKKLGLKVTVR